MSFTEYIKDPLYGIVGITQKEFDVIRTKKFQRLKNIKQLGTANFVYPGANHSRFEHSIGTMHVTSLMLDRLKVDGTKKQIVRLAALLHDVGHGPFSHTFEEILDRNPDYVPFVEGKPLKGHEDFSEYIFKNDNELKGVLGSELNEISSFLSGEKAIDKIPSEIITGDIGADRIDYLIRDTYYTGLGHRPDIDSLISNMQISVKEKSNPRLTIRKEGILSAELLITTRYYHFSMIVHNPKTRSVELLFLKLVEKLLEKERQPEDYMLQAFTRYDDSIILANLFKSDSSLRDLFYSGKSFVPLYNIPLGEIRSGLTKYCIYRFFYDKKGLMEYTQKVSNVLAEKIGLGNPIVDVHLFKHYVPDIIFHSDKYETEKEWISPFALDHSHLLRSIPGEQLRQSSIRILYEQDPGDERQQFMEKIDQNRSAFLSGDFLVPLLRDSMTKNGFQLIDDFYTFLCALRDFYSEKPWKDKQSKQEEIFRGISRFYDLIDISRQKLKRPALDLKDFFKEENQLFRYSIKGFSILNALAVLEVLRLDYVPDKPDPIEKKPYHSVYVIRPIEREIRARLYEGLSEFNSLKEEFIQLFRKLDWGKYFEKFFPLKTGIQENW
jgi:HD superfamily phosphohydrolase